MSGLGNITNNLLIQQKQTLANSNQPVATTHHSQSMADLQKIKDQLKVGSPTLYSHIMKPTQVDLKQSVFNSGQHSSHQQVPAKSPIIPCGYKQSIINVHLRSTSEQQQQQSQHQHSNSQSNQSLKYSTPLIQDGSKVAKGSAFLLKPPQAQITFKSSLLQASGGTVRFESETGSTIVNTFHQHKNSAGSTTNSHYLNLVPPTHNVALMQTTSDGLSNFIKKPKRKRPKNKAFAVVGMRIAGNTNKTEENNDQSELEDNIDKGMLLKPGEEVDSSENGEGSDSESVYNEPRTTPVLMIPKQMHSHNINLQEELNLAQNRDVSQFKSTSRLNEGYEGSGKHLPEVFKPNEIVPPSLTTQRPEIIQDNLDSVYTEQAVLFPDNFSQNITVQDLRLPSKTQVNNGACIYLDERDSQGNLVSTVQITDPLMSEFARSINRMSDITRQISSKVQELRQSQKDEQQKFLEQEGQSVREEDQYEVEEEDTQEHAWRYNNRDEEIKQQRLRQEEGKDGVREDPGLKLKEGQIQLQAVSSNLPKEMFETQIVDQYTIYGQSVLRTVLRQMGPPKTKYGQLLLNQIVQSNKRTQNTSINKKNDQNLNYILKQIQQGGNSGSMPVNGVPQQQNLANFHTLQQQNSQLPSANQTQGSAFQNQQAKQNSEAQNVGGARIYLSYADHQRKRFKTIVTTKTKDDKILLSNLKYDIPNQLIDKKFIQQFVKRGQSGGITTALVPLILTEDSYEKMTSHYIRLKDVKKLYVRDEAHENQFFSGIYDFEDQYEVLEELDYYRREIRRQAAIEENRRKNLKMANVKAAAQKLQVQSKSSESPNIFRERYRYNYINWLKIQQRSDGKKMEQSDSLTQLDQMNTKSMNQIELMTVESFPESANLATTNQQNNMGNQPEKSPMIVQFKKDKLVIGNSEVNRSKIGSFLQLVNNAASGLGNNREVQLSAIGSNIPLKSGGGQLVPPSQQGLFRTPEKSISLGGNGTYKFQTMSHPFLARQDSQSLEQPETQPTLELKASNYTQAQTNLQSCKNSHLPPHPNNNQNVQQQQQQSQTSAYTFTQLQQQALNNLNSNFQLRQNVENELKMQHLQRDAGKLISKFEELNKEHEELEKLKRYAENHFSTGIPNLSGAESFVGQSQQVKYLHRPTQTGASPSNTLKIEGDYFQLLQNAQFGDINNPSPLFGNPGQLTVGPVQSQQRIQMKSSSASTFGIKLQNSQGSQVHKVQQQSRFNIILANKKHNLQRKYMELIREKDQVLNEFYNYSKLQQNGQSKKFEQSKEKITNPPATAQTIGDPNHHFTGGYPMSDDSVDTVNPSFDMHPMKVFIDEAQKSPYKTIQKNGGVIPHNGGRLGAYNIIKSSKNKGNGVQQATNKFSLPPAVTQQISRTDSRKQVFSRKGLTSSQSSLKPDIKSPTRQMLIEQGMTPPPPTQLDKQDVESFHHRYTVEHDTFLNINVPNSANQTTASGIFSFGQLSRRDEPNAQVTFLNTATNHARGINELIMRRQSQNRITTNISSNREPQMYRGGVQNGGDLEQFISMAGEKEDPTKSTPPIPPKPKDNGSSTRPSVEGAANNSPNKTFNDTPQKQFRKKATNSNE